MAIALYDSFYIERFANPKQCKPFANPKQCHNISGALYRDIIAMHSLCAIRREPGGGRSLRSQVHGSWAWPDVRCEPASDTGQTQRGGFYTERIDKEQRTTARAHVSLPPLPSALPPSPEQTWAWFWWRNFNFGAAIKKILLQRRRYSMVRLCWLIPKANCLSLTYRASEMLTH